MANNRVIAVEANLVNIVLQYGIAGLAIYFMYKLMCNHVQAMTSVLCKKLDEVKNELKELREALVEKLSR